MCMREGFFQKAEIMDSSTMQRAITRISFEILERNKGVENICLIGLMSRGVILAERIAKKMSEVEKKEISVGTLDITPFRDDHKCDNLIDNSNISFSIEDKKVILVDDVIFTGRTARAAIDGLLSRGRPNIIQFAVLVDRGHRELPIRADYVGKNLPSSRDEIIQVMVEEIDGSDKVVIYGKS